MKRQQLLGLLFTCLVFVGCAGRPPEHHISREASLLSEHLRNEIRKIEQSIVTVSTVVRYEVQIFEDEAGQPIQPANGRQAVRIEKDEKTLRGGGLLIKVDKTEQTYTILTSAHLVAPKDTIDVYYTDKQGGLTNILFSRSIVKQVVISVRGQSYWRAAAELVAVDPGSDLAIITSETEHLLGNAFSNRVGYDLELGWGDWVFLFGFPKGVKQMTGGWVSESPYPGIHLVDAVVRSGFSGGPVFTISHDGTELMLVGLIKSVPSSMLEYIAPKKSMPSGRQIKSPQLEELVVKRQNLVDYGSAYFVNPATINAFFRSQRAALQSANIELPDKYFN